MHQPSHLVPSGSQAFACTGANQHIQGFGSRQVVANRADTAQSLHEHGGLPVRPSLDKTLKTPELHNVESGLCNLVLIIQMNGDLAVTLNPGNRFYGDFL
jgi:hypothetical protein